MAIQFFSFYFFSHFFLISLSSPHILHSFLFPRVFVLVSVSTIILLWYLFLYGSNDISKNVAYIIRTFFLVS